MGSTLAYRSVVKSLDWHILSLDMKIAFLIDLMSTHGAAEPDV
jgi:hypothetical protein